MRKIIVAAVARIDEERVLALVRRALEKGVDPFAVLEDVRRGLELVVEKYNKGAYFLADLVMAAEIYREAQQLTLGPLEESLPGPPQIVFGTVRKDIHDIGKNITIVTMRQFGLSVRDLGVDVAPEAFVEALRATGAPILCMSGLISDAYDSMKETVELVREVFPSCPPVVVIGGRVNEAVRSYTGADYWVRNCTEGAALCRRILEERRPLGQAVEGGGC